MKLHAPNRKLLMLHAHDFTFVGLGRNFQTIRQSVALDYQRMIARGGKRIRHTLEEILSVMLNERRFAVHHSVIHNDVAAENVPDALMSETDAERRHLRTK